MAANRIPRKIIAALVATALVMLISSVFAYRAAKWALARMHRGDATTAGVVAQPRESAAHQAPQGNNTLDAESLRPMQVGAVMSDAFKTGKLPDPLEFNAADPDTAAVELARLVSLRDEHSTAALLTSFKTAGFNVRDADGKVLVGAKNSGQGIGFESWEVASIAKLYGDEFHITLADFSDAITQSSPGFKDVPLGKLLLEAIRTDTESQKPELRFWSRFLVQLGKQANPGYDLMSPTLDPTNATLDAVQFAFITRRLAADFAILGAKGSKTGQNRVSQQSHKVGCSGRFQDAELLKSHRTPRWIDGVWHPTELLYTPAAFQEGSSNTPNLPCNMTEGQLQILDAAAAAFGVGFDQLMELLSVSGVLTDGVTIFNVITAYGKLALAEMTAEATITMDSTPLVRRTSPEPGCQRKLTATLMQKTGNWQLLNCLRLALLHAGIDVDVPKDGPIEGAKTQWHIVEGGASVSQAGAAGSNTAIVEWVSTGPRIQDAGTYAGIPGIVSGGTAVSDFSQPTTSEQGTVEIMIEGCARRNDLNGWAVPVMKTAKVQLTFAVKPPNLKEDVLNALEGSAALLSGPMVLLTTVPVEMFLRSRWFASPVFTIPVKDWQACNSGWSGKMSFEKTRHWSHTETGPDTYGGTWTQSLTIDEDCRQEWQLGGSQHDDPAGGIAVDATWTALIKNRQVGTYRRPRENQCPPSEQTMAGQDEGHVQVIIGFLQETADTQTYYIGADIPSGPFKPDAVKWSSSGGCPGGVVGGSKPVDVTSFNASGTVDPKDPNHLSGIKRTVDPDGTDTIVKWDLHICGRVGDVCGQQK